MTLKQLIERIAVEELDRYNSNMPLEELLNTKGIKKLEKELENCSSRYQINTLREFFGKAIRTKSNGQEFC